MGYDWCPERYHQDAELLKHLEKCSRCRNLVRAETAIGNDMKTYRLTVPEKELSFGALRERILSRPEAGSAGKPGGIFNTAAINPRFRIRYPLAAGIMACFLGFMFFFPFTFKEKVGYEVAIAGVDRNIAMDNEKIGTLLDALGMDKEKTETLLDSLETNKIHLSLGDCHETCQLKISDLKTEKDVRLVVRAIIELGCCQIDDIIPVFRNESGSLLEHAVRKLFS